MALDRFIDSLDSEENYQHYRSLMDTYLRLWEFLQILERNPTETIEKLLTAHYCLFVEWEIRKKLDIIYRYVAYRYILDTLQISVLTEWQKQQIDLYCTDCVIRADRLKNLSVLYQRMNTLLIHEKTA